jgi:hypothetical protein
MIELPRTVRGAVTGQAAGASYGWSKLHSDALVRSFTKTETTR